MDIDKKTKELKEASGVIALLKTILANPTATGVLKKEPATQFELIEAQVNILEMFEGVAAMIIIADKEIKELKLRLQAVESLDRGVANVLVGGAAQ